MKQFFAAAFILLAHFQLSAQEKNMWSLQDAVDYAVKHNLTIRQNEVNARLARLRADQAKLSQLPNINASGSYGRSYGRSVDPTTNQFVTGTSYDFVGLSANADVLLFGWFQKRNTIAANRLSFEAAEADLDQAKDDISLNVATAYLRALLTREQIKVAGKQVELSKAQLQQTRRFAEAGRLPELSVAQLEAQLSNDSANLIQAISDYNSSILDIKALLNFDFEDAFDVEEPVVKVSEQFNVMNMEAEDIYVEARRHLGTVKSSELKLRSSQKNLSAAKGNLYPQIAVSAQAGTNYSTTFKDFNLTGTAFNPVLGTYAVGSTDTIQVYQATPTFTTTTTPLGKQLDNNFRQTISLGMNIPIFNAWQVRYNVKQAKLNVETQELNRHQVELTLRQNVYKAHNDARNSIQKYYAAERAAEAAQRAFDFAQKRYDLGLTNTVEYLTTQNTLYNAESKLAGAKYDLIFKIKVIDYYLGNELKL